MHHAPDATVIRSGLRRSRLLSIAVLATAAILVFCATATNGRAQTPPVPEGKPTGRGWCAIHRAHFTNGFCPQCSAVTPVPLRDPAAERLADLNQRFRDVFDELIGFGVPNLEDLTTISAASSLEELTGRIDRVYREAAFYKSQRYWRHEENFKELASYPGWFRERRERLADLQQRLQSAPGKLQHAEARLAEVSVLVEREEYWAAQLGGNASTVHDDFLNERGRALWAIYHLLPAEQRGEYHEAIRLNGHVPAYALNDRVEPAVPAPMVREPVPATADRPGLPPHEYPPFVAGTIEEKLAAFGTVREVLGYVSQLLPSQEQRLAAFGRDAANLREQIEAIEPRLEEIESPLTAAQSAIDGMEKRLLAAQVNQKISAENLLRLAAAAVVWEHVNRTVVAPALETFVENNRFATSLKGLALLEQLNSAPEGLIPSVGALTDLPRLIATERKVLEVEQNFEAYALEAAEALGRGGQSSDSALLTHMFQGLSRQGIDIMRTASGAFEGASGKIVDTLLDRAPTD